MNVGCDRRAALDKSEDLFVLDYISHYNVSDNGAVYLKVENLLDERAIVSRQPEGARPNKPRTASVGLEWTF
jgi:Fe(3+) dicitrate transport protein